MKLTYLESLPAGYRFTDEDNDANWEIMGPYFLDPDFEMTPEQSDFTSVMEIAERLKHKLGFWPTKETLIEKIREQTRRQNEANDKKEREWHLKQTAPVKS
jgi:hypothetical protein